MMEDVPDIAPFRQRYDELDQEVASPDFYADARRAATLSREHQKLARLIEQYEALEKVRTDLADNRAMADDPSADEELAELAREELPELEAEATRLKEAILLGMIPPDPNDSRNTVMEIRAGAGGDEASLFAADLYRMYSRFAETKGLKVEQLSASESESGGFKEVVFSVSGEDVFKALKYESGVHRVQRIPVTEANGRIHTSTATVAVLPEAEEVDIEIKSDDLEISVSRASGPGGQGVNTTDSAVQILHKPTGVIVHCADERSQLKNKLKAMRVLRSRLLQAKEEEERAKYAADRKGQIGTGDRSERIRTYNFPQSRVTDHRINLTLHSLDEVIAGEIDPLIEGLSRAEYERRVADLTSPDSIDTEA